ncbi:T-cell immunoreceptor with Ig and ITIM domains isoform X2 [Ranitomeya imitator]|uniref:T-cell immunoreceptor with Ig and ITIM domains isoform X2 n=1 Tax=Ranitomeya imitator TaxID=111125 RepID=UPI0037E82E53
MVRTPGPSTMTPHPRDCALQMIVFLLPTTVPAVAETFLKAQNITATDGKSVTLRCQLLIQDTKVVQVNWNFCNDLHIAYHLNDHETEGMVMPAFSDRVTLAKDYGIVISDVSRNDTGQYCCVFNTFPHGVYTGRIYLQVVSEDSWRRGPYLWIGSGVGILLLVTVTVAGSFYYKVKRRKKEEIRCLLLEYHRKDTKSQSHKCKYPKFSSGRTHK